MELGYDPLGPFVALLLRVAFGKLRVYLRFQFAAIDQASRGENEKGRLALREKSMVGGRIQKNARGDSPGSFAFGSGHVSGAFAPETN
jgi:hypothetical protein